MTDRELKTLMAQAVRMSPSETVQQLTYQHQRYKRAKPTDIPSPIPSRFTDLQTKRVCASYHGGVLVHCTLTDGHALPHRCCEKHEWGHKWE